MVVVKQEQEFMYTLPDTELTESGSLADTDTSSTVISPLFVIMPADVDETGQPSAVENSESFNFQRDDDGDDDDRNDVDDDNDNNDVTSRYNTSAVLTTQSLINKALRSNVVVTIEALSIDRIKRQYKVSDTLKDTFAANAEPLAHSPKRELDPHVCTICGKRFPRSPTLHMLAHAGANRCGKNRVMPDDNRQTYNCSICPFKTLFRTSLIRHSRLMHADMTANRDTSRQRKRRNARHEFECNKCQFKTRFCNSLTSHKRLMHGNKMSFTDVTCDRTDHEKHNEANHTSDCSNCESKTATHLVNKPQAQKQDVSLPSKLKLNHKDNKRNLFDALASATIVLDATEKKMVDKKQLDNDQHHSNDPLSVHRSTICNANDNTNNETSQLVKPGTTPSEHVCNVCGKRCKYARSLALHMKAHNDVKNHVSSFKETDFTSTFSCSRCSFVTSYKSSILRHVNLMHKISNPQSADEAVSPSNHGSAENDGNRSRHVLNNVLGYEREVLNLAKDSDGQENPTTTCVNNSSQFNHGNIEDDRDSNRQVISDERDDEWKKLNVTDDNNGQEIPRTAYNEDSSQSNHSNDEHMGNDDDNDDTNGGAETDVATAAECCVSSESVKVVELEQTVHNDASIIDSHIDRVVDKPAGHECTICGRRFARSLRLHMLAHTGRKYLTPDDTRQTYNCIKCPFKTVFRGSLARHDRVMHRKMIHSGDVSHHSKCDIKHGGDNAVIVFECSKCQFKTRFSTALTRHDRLMHKSHKHHNVRDNKQPSECQSEYKQLNKDSVRDTQMDSYDLVSEADAVKDSNVQRHCNRGDKRSRRRKKRKCNDDSQVQEEEQSLLQLGDMKVCERKKYACSECGLMMMHQSAMITHCKAVHGCGLCIHLKPHFPAPTVCNNGSLQSTFADSGLYFPQQMNSVQLPSSLPSTATASDVNVPASGCATQLTSNLCSTTTVEMPAAATNAFTSVDDSCKYIYSARSNGSVTELVNVASHKCDSCHLTFDDMSAFQSHHCTGSASVLHPQPNSVVVIDSTSLRCPTCVKAFASVSELHRHIENSSANECGKAYLCQFCSKCFVTSYHLTIHTKQHFGTKLHQCEVCGRDFTSFAKLKRHWSLHDGTNPNTCHVCGHQYSSSVVFRRHVKKCRKNGEENNPPSSVIPESSEKVAKLLTCHVCQKTTDSLAEMHEHKLTHRSDHCNSLQAKTTAPSSGKFDSAKLFQHKSSLCSVCGKIYANTMSLKRHMTLWHSDIVAAKQENTSTDEKAFKCPKCDKVFSRPWRHTRCLTKRKRSQGRRFHCKECSRNFSTREALKTHERRHAGTDERRFLCKFCGDRFYQLSHLQNHTRLHTGEKPHCCEICGRRFCQVSSFQNHLRIHSGERPFLCSQCNKGFVTSSDLKEHIIVMHTDRKDFQCPVCGWKFALRKAMRRHVKDRHGAQFLDD